MPSPKLSTPTLDGWRSSVLLPALVLSAVLPLTAAPAPEPVEATFQQYCHACHGDAGAMAGVSLTKLAAQTSMGPSFQQWQKVIDVLEDGRMPPEGLPAPSEDERNQATIKASVRGVALQDGGAESKAIAKLAGAHLPFVTIILDEGSAGEPAAL